MDQLSRCVRRRRTDSGLSLIEVMMALAVLSFGMLAMLAMQIHALRGGRVGRHYSQAATIARDRMELFHRLAWTNAAVQPTGGWVLAGETRTSTVQTGGVGVQEQAFTVDWRISADGADPDLRHIDVRVTWREPADNAAMPPRRYAITSMRYSG